MGNAITRLAKHDGNNSYPMSADSTKQLFKKIPQRKVSEEVFVQIRDLINDGKLLPGDRLPSERELAEVMNVSRTSVREALLKLECLGFIEQKGGEGKYVTSLTKEPLTEAFNQFMKGDHRIKELLELRKVLESWAASLAARHATDEDIEKMEKTINEMKRLKKSKPCEYDPNLKFHLHLASATKNTLLCHVMDTISQWIRQVRYEVQNRMETSPGIAEDLLKQHTAILDAIKRRDEKAAAESMIRHIDYTIKVMELNEG